MSRTLIDGDNLADDLRLPGTGAVEVPSGTGPQRKPSALDGAFRYSKDLIAFEGKINGAWSKFAMNSPDFAVVQVRRTTTLSLGPTASAITFDTVDYESLPSAVTQHPTDKSRINILQSGPYLLTFVGEDINTINTAIDTYAIYVNGSGIRGGSLDSMPRSARNTMSRPTIVPLNAGDYVQVYAFKSAGTGTLQTDAQLMVMRLQGSQGPAGPAGGQSSLYFPAASFDNPNNSNWAVNSLAALSADPANAALLVRAFDDTTEEGVGCTVYVPPSAATLTITLTAKCATAPTSAKSVIFRMFSRRIVLNSAVGAWSAGIAMPAFAAPTNIFYQTYTKTFTLSELGLSAGDTAQLELTRYGNIASDTLVGDLHLLNATISFG